MVDHLARLADEAADRVENGYYSKAPAVTRPRRSLTSAIRSCTSKNAVISEVKYASPSAGRIRSFNTAESVAKEMVAGGACALSVLTASGAFAGDVSYLAAISESVEIPVLMKDIVVSPVQLRAGARMGADAVVLIAELYANGLSEYSLSRMRTETSKLGLELLLEATSPQEFSTLEDYRPDLYGVNNRDLSSLQVNLDRTIEIVSASGKPASGPLVSESGIETPEDVRRLRLAGADAFLIGTSIMRAEDIQSKVKELVNA